MLLVELVQDLPHGASVQEAEGQPALPVDDAGGQRGEDVGVVHQLVELGPLGEDLLVPGLLGELR